MSSARKSQPVARRSEPMILFAVGAYRFAIPAADVDEIRETFAMKPFRPVPMAPQVKYTATRAGREYLVVDTGQHLRLMPSKATRLLMLRSSAVAITADAIDRMTEVPLISALPAAFTGEERQWYRGLAVIGGDVVPVVNPESFLEPARTARLQQARLGVQP